MCLLFFVSVLSFLRYPDLIVFSDLIIRRQQQQHGIGLFKSQLAGQASWVGLSRPNNVRLCVFYHPSMITCVSVFFAELWFGSLDKKISRLQVVTNCKPYILGCDLWFSTAALIRATLVVLLKHRALITKTKPRARSLDEQIVDAQFKVHLTAKSSHWYQRLPVCLSVCPTNWHWTWEDLESSVVAYNLSI